MRPRHEESGAAAVEFAIVAPLLIMLVMGIIAFGTVFAQKLSLGNAARQAARFGVVASRTCADITSEARDAVSGTLAMVPAQVAITVKRGQTASAATSVCHSDTDTTEPCQNSAENDSLYVTASYSSKLVIPFAVVRSALPISGQGVFRCEFS